MTPPTAYLQGGLGQGRYSGPPSPQRLSTGSAEALENRPSRPRQTAISALTKPTPSARLIICASRSASRPPIRPSCSTCRQTPMKATYPRSHDLLFIRQRPRGPARRGRRTMTAHCGAPLVEQGKILEGRIPVLIRTCCFWTALHGAIVLQLAGNGSPTSAIFDTSSRAKAFFVR